MIKNLAINLSLNKKSKSQETHARDNGNSGIKRFYYSLKHTSNKLSTAIEPYFRRILRFIALPYCYFRLVNWKECPVSRSRVLSDLLYIFFILKYFPDNYSLCRLWEKDRSEWKLYYGSIYDPYQRGRLRKEVQPKEYEILFEDKNVCYQLCKAADFNLPLQYGCTDKSDKLKNIIRDILTKGNEEKLIIKPVDGKGGAGIVLAARDSGDIIIHEKNIKYQIDRLEIKGLHVIQGFIKQNEKLSQIAPSINTVRVITFLTKDDNVLLLGAYMRFGVDYAFIDNVSSGGISVGIDVENGKFKKYAFDNKGKKYESHPNSNVIFENFEIPYWDKVVDMLKNIQHYFFYYKLLGHDIAITNEGVVIVEINAAPDMVAMEQRYGPILANKKNRNEFKKFNLLINRVS